MPSIELDFKYLAKLGHSGSFLFDLHRQRGTEWFQYCECSMEDRILYQLRLVMPWLMDLKCCYLFWMHEFQNRHEKKHKRQIMCIRFCRSLLKENTWNSSIFSCPCWWRSKLGEKSQRSGRKSKDLCQLHFRFLCYVAKKDFISSYMESSRFQCCCWSLSLHQNDYLLAKVPEAGTDSCDNSVQLLWATVAGQGIAATWGNER